MNAPLTSVSALATAEPTELPRALGRYTLLGELASGGMAKVYLGQQVGAAGFERIVAIKCCHEHLRSNRAFAEMFLEEARLAARIRHHNVVATLDVSDGNPLYLVMEYVEGCSLSTLARTARQADRLVPLDIALRVICDVLAGLHAAHECCGPDGERLGLVHCDVSPENILVGVDGSARITDFGVTRVTARMGIEGQSVIKGKPSYMAPEQLCSGEISGRVDVFAAGVVLWELLTGRPLFRSGDDWGTMHAVLTRAIPAPSSVEPSVPPALDAVLLRALERHPARRFASAGDFLAALERLPLPMATARRMGQYVHRERGASLSAGRLPSGKYPRAVAAEAQGAVPPSAVTIDEAPAPELATRILEPPRELVAATARDRDPSLPEAYRVRRMIVAITLVLVGCAVGLLFAHQAAPSSASPTAPFPVAPAPLDSP